MKTPDSHKPKLLSVVSPVYLGEQSVGTLVEEISAFANSAEMECEIILVEDGSPDDSWGEIVRIASLNPRVRGIRLSRNFGQHSAITAGLASAHGDLVAVMDCDLQDDPRDLLTFIRKSAEGYDIVFSSRPKRAHSRIKNFCASLYFRLFNLLTDAAWKQAGSDRGTYTLMTRKAVDAFLEIKDVHRHFLMVLRWLGFRHTSVEVSHRPRAHGKSSYTFFRLIRHAMVGLTTQSNRFLYLAVIIGMGYGILALLGAVFVVAQYITLGSLVGWTSLAVLLLLSTGFVLIAIGVLGIYLGNVFDQVRGRPIYLIAQEVGFQSKDV